MIVNSERLIPSAAPSSFTTASFARPSAGASATRTASSSRPSAPIRQPQTPGLAERVVTRTGTTEAIRAWAYTRRANVAHANVLFAIAAIEVVFHIGRAVTWHLS